MGNSNSRQSSPPCSGAESPELVRLQEALVSGEHIRLASSVGLYRAAAGLRLPWSDSREAISQEVALYLWHLQTETNSGWDAARGAWSTWATLCLKGLLWKWQRQARGLRFPPADCVSLDGIDLAATDIYAIRPEGFLAVCESPKPTRRRKSGGGGL